jgi:DNA-binding transcriptional LysR family regulator
MATQAERIRQALRRNDRRTMLRDFNDYQFFPAGVLHHGFSAATRALGVPESRVSRHVVLLEDYPDVPLLDPEASRAQTLSPTEVFSVT